MWIKVDHKILIVLHFCCFPRFDFDTTNIFRKINFNEENQSGLLESQNGNIGSLLWKSIFLSQMTVNDNGWIVTLDL